MRTQYQGRTFDRKQMFYEHQLKLIRDYITSAQQKTADTILFYDWDFDPSRTLDQGDKGHCEGYDWAHYGICAPICDDWYNADGDRIYYESVAQGGYPNSEDGSTTLWGAKAMQKDEGRIATYAFASSIDEMITWLATRGPLSVGTNWYQDMMTPDADGRVHVGGYLAGGHAWLIRGFDRSASEFHAINSWGQGWGQRGAFSISFSEFKRLLDEQGDCCMAIELPLTAPKPEPLPNGCFPRKIHS